MKAGIVLTEKGIAPHGVQCIICGRVAKPGQFVLLHTIENVQHVIMHQFCLREVAETIPDDLQNSIDEEYEKIRESLIKECMSND